MAYSRPFEEFLSNGIEKSSVFHIDFHKAVCLPIGSTLLLSPWKVLYPNENYYLCFNKKSMHIGVWNDGRDSAAVSIAEKLLTLP